MAGTADYLRDPSLQLLVNFFRDKGLAALKREDRQEEWYQDWLDFQAKHGLYASLLSPRRYSSLGNRFSLRRLTRFLECFSYHAPAHAYSLHVSFLGLFPIVSSSNEALAKEAVARLEKGGLFAFGVSEQAHGSDLFANEFMVTPAADGGWLAHGSKYYIGNANAASIITILGKKGNSETADPTKRAPFIFLAVRLADAPAMQNVKRIHTLGIRSAFVGSFDVKRHPLPKEDIISEGREAWDAAFATVNLGKYFLGFGAVGICEHAFVEAFLHMRNRTLYGKPVTEMPHIRATTAVAFARLTAMKLYAYRALDYLQISQKSDRRYLLFNAIQKAKVSTEGVKVVGLLAECIGARGVESETYFESALRDAQLIPGLEGSTHINFGLTAQFIANYFASPSADLPIPASVFFSETEPDENPYWWQARDRIAKTVFFGHYLKAFEPLQAIPNVRTFTKQVKAFSLLAAHGVSTLNPDVDAGLSIAMGKCFATIAYAQLVAENCVLAKLAPELVSVIFHGMIEDLSAESLKLSAMFLPGSVERPLFKRIVRVPKTIVADLEAVSEFIAKRYQNNANHHAVVEGGAVVP